MNAYQIIIITLHIYVLFNF